MLAHHLVPIVSELSRKTLYGFAVIQLPTSHSSLLRSR
jgi:hypothetical protein